MQERSAGAVARFIRLPVIHIRIRQGDMANLTGLVNQDQIDRMFIKQSRETTVYQRYFDRISLSGKQNRRSRHLLQLDTITEMVPDIIEYIPFRYRAIFPDKYPSDTGILFSRRNSVETGVSFQYIIEYLSFVFFSL